MFPLRCRFGRGGIVNAAAAGYGFVLPEALFVLFHLSAGKGGDAALVVPSVYWMQVATIAVLATGMFFLAVEPLAWCLRTVPGAHVLAALLTAAVLLRLLDIATIRTLDTRPPFLWALCGALGALRYWRAERFRRRAAGVRVADVFD